MFAGVSGDREKGRNESKRTTVLPRRPGEIKTLSFGDHNGSY